MELADDVIFAFTGKCENSTVSSLSDLGIPVLLLAQLAFGHVDLKMVVMGFYLIILNYNALFHVGETWDDPDFSQLNVVLKSLCYFPYPSSNYLRVRERHLESMYEEVQHAQTQDKYIE